MKQILITIAALVLVGCGGKVDIWEAAYDGNMEAVKHHLDAGADVNVKDVVGETPLHVAALMNNAEVAELLIDEGADVNMKNEGGDTPLDFIDGHSKEPPTSSANMAASQVIGLRLVNLFIKLREPDTFKRPSITWLLARM